MTIRYTDVSNSAFDAIGAASGLLLDLDGTLRVGARWAAGSEPLLSRFGTRTIVISNDSEHTPEQLSRLFSSWGRPLPPEHFVLAGAVAMETLRRECPGVRVRWFGSDALAHYGKRLGLRLVEQDSDIVLLGRDRGLTFERLGSAVSAVAKGASLIACNSDLTHPGWDGGLVPETGMISAAVRAGAGGAPCRYIGKPERLMFDIALDRLGIDPREALMIGDNRETDGEGARRVGIPFLHASVLRALDNDGPDRASPIMSPS
jgi:HAD superfamily hydrolase (TIGR01450 family)